MEKGFLYWKSDLIIEFDFFEMGFDWFVKFDKFDFVGKEVLVVCYVEGVWKLFVVLEIKVMYVLVYSGGFLMYDGVVVGMIMLGDWGYCVGKNLVYVFVDFVFVSDGS